MILGKDHTVDRGLRVDVSSRRKQTSRGGEEEGLSKITERSLGEERGPRPFVVCLCIPGYLVLLI